MTVFQSFRIYFRVLTVSSPFCYIYFKTLDSLRGCLHLPKTRYGQKITHLKTSKSTIFYSHKTFFSRATRMLPQPTILVSILSQTGRLTSDFSAPQKPTSIVVFHHENLLLSEPLTSRNDYTVSTHDNFCLRVTDFSVKLHWVSHKTTFAFEPLSRKIFTSV